MSSQTGDPAIQQVENAGPENKPDSGVKEIARGIRIRRLQQRALDNLQRARKSAKQITRRHQIRQEINLGTRLAHFLASRAITLEPPDTRSPTLTRTTASRGKYTSVREPKRIIPKRSPFLSSSPTFAQPTILRAIMPVSCRTTITPREFSKAQVIALFFSEQSRCRASRQRPS